MKRYTKAIIWISFSLFLAFNASAAINPIYKECSQRGYGIEGDYCVFPDSTKCLLEDFNSGQCGEKWMTDDYCIPEGGYVWDSGRCCEGLVAYLPEGMAGQASCQKKSKVMVKKTFFDSYAGIGLVILSLIGILFFLRRKNRKS
jgi:hypothetical protein